MKNKGPATAKYQCMCSKPYLTRYRKLNNLTIRRQQLFADFKVHTIYIGRHMYIHILKRLTICNNYIIYMEKFLVGSIFRYYNKLLFADSERFKPAE
jgi:hypothetical protein